MASIAVSIHEISVHGSICKTGSLPMVSIRSRLRVNSRAAMSKWPCLALTPDAATPIKQPISTFTLPSALTQNASQTSCASQ